MSSLSTLQQKQYGFTGLFSSCATWCLFNALKNSHKSVIGSLFQFTLGGAFAIAANSSWQTARLPNVKKNPELYEKKATQVFLKTLTLDFAFVKKEIAKDLSEIDGKLNGDEKGKK